MRALTSFFGTGSAALVESLLLAVAFSWLGYRMSVRHRAVRGVTPWRIPSYLWALICLVFQFLGIALEILAELTTRPALPISQPPAEPLQPYTYSPPMAAPTTGAALAGPNEVDSATPPPPDGAGGAPAGFGWYADPLRRHELRYFDGRLWSEFVADVGAVDNDPL